MGRCGLMEVSEYISNDDHPVGSRQKDRLELHNSLAGNRKQRKQAYRSCPSFQTLLYLHIERRLYAYLAGLLVKITWKGRTRLTLR